MGRTRTTRSTAITLLAIAAILTTIAGPVIDHHFAERQASHGHVFAHQAYPDHGHMSDEGHAHEGGESLAVGVIATGDNDVSGSVFDNVAPPASYRSDIADLRVHLVGIASDEDGPLGVISAPLVRPPIV